MYDLLSNRDKMNLFEKKLQLFAKEVEILCALESGGKLEPREAYSKIKTSWKKLKVMKKDLLPKIENMPVESSEVIENPQSPV
ncbi:DUF7219 family protein [Pseudobacteriovorax antillogorgiicola]|uniref:Uncharacterized protein n=1 Tax=Pseudobacteriovorax antillogorgiicola TaxID=1513793 RepID=A0A1Y6BL92_9BACT|nr:hypothetical protein [Pseudobacteriovorax antillogorgiicola]TCS54640.1 hypothetical protein EDD56_106153 [Pseudobacteriovorax antillogorgiicola]SMF17041.1 hypothetical protein SAMN06296036_10690 [Pseudobacteriovorax antillogorgiicola]